MSRKFKNYRFLCLCRPTVSLHHSRSSKPAWDINAKFECHSLNTVRDMAIIVQVKHLSSLRCSCDLEWRARSSDGKKIIQTFRQTLSLTANVMEIAWSWIVPEIIKHVLFSRWRSVRPWMKVNVKILINTWCILMSEAVTMPSLMRNCL